jgi:SAM-dependent methyltransferase
VEAAVGSKRYSHNYYRSQQRGSLRSAREVVPIVVDLVRPRSVIDVGCGIGTWASVFRELGLTDVWGIDGDYVQREALLIPAETFLPFDLTRPLSTGRTFDLAVSLEVAEHLPPPSAAAFVDSLTALADHVLFSAAVPYQGGTNHINERWQDEWARLFEERGYLPVDCIRPAVWQNERVVWFYAQNTLLFVKREALDRQPTIARLAARTSRSQLAMLHPKALHSIATLSLVSLLARRIRKSTWRRLMRLRSRAT